MGSVGESESLIVSALELSEDSLIGGLDFMVAIEHYFYGEVALKN
jgi:hypothetical protein